MKIAFIYAPGRMARLSQPPDSVPTDFFYGALELQAEKHDIGFFEIGASAHSLAGALDARFGRLLPVRGSLDHFLQARKICGKLNAFDCAVATNSRAGMSLAALRLTGNLRVPVVTIHCGIVNFQHTAWRRKITKPLLAAQEVVLFARSEAAEIKSVFDVKENHLHVSDFGVDCAFWTPQKTKTEFIFAVGNDGRRDFDAYATAAGRVKYPHRLLTRQPLREAPPSNLEHIQGKWDTGLSDEELRDWYRKSLCVVVPLKETLQPSGQSVALQAMACGRPVIMTRTQGYWLHEDFKNEEHVLIVEPDSVEALTAAMNKLVDDPLRAEAIGLAGRELMLKHYSIKRFALGLEAACRCAIERSHVISS